MEGSYIASAISIGVSKQEVRVQDVRLWGRLQRGKKKLYWGVSDWRCSRQAHGHGTWRARLLERRGTGQGLGFSPGGQQVEVNAQAVWRRETLSKQEKRLEGNVWGWKHSQIHGLGKVNVGTVEVQRQRSRGERKRDADAVIAVDTHFG